MEISSKVLQIKNFISELLMITSNNNAALYTASSYIEQVLKKEDFTRKCILVEYIVTIVLVIYVMLSN